MKYRGIYITIAFLLIALGGLYAQESPTATGGEAMGTGGTASYSIGQVFYTTHLGTNYNVAQGVQQAYEISTTVGINEIAINLELSVYPNPTTNYLTLKVEKPEGLSYQVYDMQGRLIASNKVVGISTKIEMGSLASATYFLNVVKDNQIIKTFRIIKN